MSWKVEVAMMSARDWELYASSMDCTEAATALNQSMIEGLTWAFDNIRDGMPREEAAIKLRDWFKRVQRKYSEYGAEDTEPDAVKVEVINRVLGTDIERW